MRRIEWGYDALGRVETVTSYNAVTSGSAVNGVKFAYDGWGNVEKIYQVHDDEAAGAGGEPYVGYTYADDPTDNAAKYIRLTKITLPNGRDVFYNYPASGTIGYALGRVDNIASVANASNAADKFSAYTYLGAGTVVQTQYPAVKIGGSGNAMALTYGTGGTYSGLDAFGRVIDQKWTINSTTPDEYQYTYDAGSNRTTRANSATTGKDEKYRYDQLDRLIKLNRGSISSGDIADTAATASQAWAKWDSTGNHWATLLDSTGNWSAFKQDNDGGGVTGSSPVVHDAGWDLSQTRKHNLANEVDDNNTHGDTTDPTALTSWKVPLHDAAGNMTEMPQPGNEDVTAGKKLLATYDAWNRLVEVKDYNGGTPRTIAKYSYDGLNRRIAKRVVTSWSGSAPTWKRVDLYYNAAWQVLEERVADGVSNGSEGNLAANAKYQYVWDIRYIDAPILRDENVDNGDGSPHRKS